MIIFLNGLLDEHPFSHHPLCLYLPQHHLLSLQSTSSLTPLPPPQSLVVQSVCGGAIGHPAAVTRVGTGEGGVCGFELQGPLPGAERPDPQRTDHLQQIPQRHHRAI